MRQENMKISTWKNTNLYLFGRKNSKLKERNYEKPYHYQAIFIPRDRNYQYREATLTAQRNNKLKQEVTQNLWKGL